MNPIDIASHGPVIPVIVIDRVEDALPLAEALLAGGVKVLEVTLRTAAALPAIEAIARDLPEALVGVGTVLNADDALVAGMAESEHCQCSVLFFSHVADNPGVIAHRAKGGRAAFVRDAVIYLAEGDSERRLCALSEVTLPHTGHSDFNVHNILAAVGAAWAYGLADQAIIKGLGTYE